MMGTHVDCIQVCAFFAEFPLQPAVNSGDFGLGRFTPGDNRLVCQDNESKA